MRKSEKEFQRQLARLSHEAEIKTNFGKEETRFIQHVVGSYRPTEIKRCPFCGGTNLSFKYNMSYGHGDCGFLNARIECECSGAKGNLHRYGEPTLETEVKAWAMWNERNI